MDHHGLGSFPYLGHHYRTSRLQ